MMCGALSDAGNSTLEFLLFSRTEFKNIPDAARAYLTLLCPGKKTAVQDSTALAKLADAQRTSGECRRAFEDRQDTSHYPQTRFAG